MAKDLLALCNITFTEQRLGVDFTVNTLKTKFPDAKSFPIIVVDGFYIGGFNELKEHIDKQSGSTQILLNE